MNTIPLDRTPAHAIIHTILGFIIGLAAAGLLCCLPTGCTYGGGTIGTGLSYGGGTRRLPQEGMSFVTVYGALVDKNGKPVEGVTITTRSQHGDSSIAKTDAQGKFDTVIVVGKNEMVSFDFAQGDQNLGKFNYRWKEPVSNELWIKFEFCPWCKEPFRKLKESSTN